MQLFVTARLEKQPAYKTLIRAIKASPPSAIVSPVFETSSRLYCESELQGYLNDPRDFICQSAIARHFAGGGARVHSRGACRFYRAPDCSPKQDHRSNHRLECDLRRRRQRTTQGRSSSPQRRAAMLNRAILWAVISSIAITVLVIHL